MCGQYFLAGEAHSQTRATQVEAWLKNPTSEGLVKHPYSCKSAPKLVQRSPG